MPSRGPGWKIKPLSTLAQHDYANILKVHVLPRWGNEPVSAINAEAIQGWVLELIETHHPESVSHIYGVLRSCLKSRRWR